ncbi:MULTISPECIES: hypothetical protein [unclassified Streptomyces]|uniref:hypothetical protein n=1 Tax=unclassified Streptomyces TaxID=2593676 RepID=UPI002E162505|nr:hypothetical protein OG452_20050 [Streptomyces sp. NBC_01197]WSS49869.1 hypothetical protein OG708_15205 [Streptomyces sp. NBC_01180]
MRTGKLLSHVDERWPKGRRLVVAGWALRLAGAVLGITGWLVFQAGLNSDHLPGMLHPAWWLRGVGSLAAVGVALRVFGAGRRLVVQGKRYTADVIDSFDALAGTRYVLYLRPFSNDAVMAALDTDILGGGAGPANLFFLSGLTHEEKLVHRFGLFGRVIAVGRPGEHLPPIGAVRGQLPLDDWQSTVSSLIEGAQVVLMAAGLGPGTVWEFTEAVRLLRPATRLVVLVYCDAPAYERFREAVAVEYARRSRTEPQTAGTAWPPLPALPDYPPPARPTRPRWEIWLNGGRKRLRWDFVLKGMVVFDPGWEATFTRFDPTALRMPSWFTLRRLVKRETGPIMEQLEALAPRN